VPNIKNLNPTLKVFFTPDTVLVFYHSRVVLLTHCQDTFMFKHHVKVNFA